MTLPSVPPGDPEVTVPTVPHDHPIPRSRRVGERVVIGGMIVLFLAVAALAVLTGSQIRSEVAAEFDRRTDARDASDAVEAERQRQVFCTFIAETFEPTEALAALSRELGCPVDAQGQPVPEPTPQGAAPAASAPVRQPAAPTSAGRATPTPRPAEPDPAPPASPGPPPSQPPPPASPTPRPCPVPELPLVGCPVPR